METVKDYFCQIEQKYLLDEDKQNNILRMFVFTKESCMGRWKYFWTQLQGICGLALLLCMPFSI